MGLTLSISLEGLIGHLEIHLHAAEHTRTMLFFTVKEKETMRRKKIFKPKNIMWGLVLILLVGLALREQLRLPPEERTWHGRIAGRIPYDFRPPTTERLRATFWNKNTSQILVPQAFGIGWTINLYPLIHPEVSHNLQPK